MMQGDWVSLHGLKISAIVGVYDWEREITQRLVVDLDMQFDTQAAAASDALGDALNYAAVAERVEAYVVDVEARLIERLAGGIAALVLEEFPALAVRVCVKKPGAVRAADAVAITITRERSGKKLD
ncbi:MAG: dihydroneopterin aldolase [Pseudomonadota bacterium]